MTDPEARLRLELKLQLEATLGNRAGAYYPFLAPLLGLALEEEATERLSSLARDSVQRQTHEAVLELCRALSLERPLCLVLEDLHFADEPTLELCRELLALADEEAVCLLLLFRSDPDLPSWELGETAHRLYRHRFRELHLEALTPEDGARLASTSTGGMLNPEAATELVQRTGGNPLFVEEAARDLVERGDGATVPAAIQETLQARLARLAPETREVAAVASVVGRTFGTPLLERLVPTEQLRPALSELQRHDLVVEERRRPAPEYRFRHGLVQEATYSSLLEDRRRELHRIVGTALEELHGDELWEAYGLLARHFAEADEPEKAARYLLEAGDAARAVYADEEAIAQYRRALPFLDRLGASGPAESSSRSPQRTTSHSTSKLRTQLGRRRSHGPSLRRENSSRRSVSRRCSSAVPATSCPGTRTTSSAGRLRQICTAACFASIEASMSGPTIASKSWRTARPIDSACGRACGGATASR